MKAPSEVQLRRTKGWRMPPHTKKVARPGRWGNPFRVGVDGTAEECVARYAQHLEDNPELKEAAKRELRGWDLACFCKLGDPCHRQPLLRVANE